MSLRKLGRYEIIRVLGKGAMGIVYEGRDPNLDRRVAIKTVKVESLAPEAAAEYEARFRTEARSAARLQHPNIVSVYDSDRHGDIAYLVMEYIQGDDLKHHLDGGERYSLEQSLHLIDDLLSALEYAHRQGVVHRDIKPANLLIESNGRLKLTDFGVARMQDSEATRTQGAMVGTLKYMAPEQVQGQKVDTRADLFAVGVILYQLLTDQRPFDGENEFAIIHQIVGHVPPAPSSIDARLPTAIDAVVGRALAKRPDERFATAAEFASALRVAVRSADDPTIVPPANPLRAQGGLRSATSPGTSPMGSATVTQELELVYWKDVKDSSEPEELAVFLAKFPDGIYADLARRRLRKLQTGPVPDQTVLSGVATDGAKPAAVREPALVDATVPPAEPLPRRPVATAASHETTIPLPPRPPSSPMPALLDLTVPTVAEPRTIDEQTTEPMVRPAAVHEEGTTAPPPARRKLSAAILGSVGALAVGGLLAVTMVVRGGGEAPASAASAAAAPLAAASAASAAQPASAPVHAVAEQAGTSPVPAAAQRPASPRSGPSSAAHARATASHVRRAPSRGTPAEVTAEPLRAAAEPAPVVHEQMRAPSPSLPKAPVSSPVDACKGKLFLSLEFCLAEQCGKPGARNHPLCLKRREEARLREDSRVRD